MVGIAGIIALGILALIGCGIIMMGAVAIPVMLVHLFRDKMHKANKEGALDIRAALIILGTTLLVVYPGIKLFEIFIPAVIEMMNISLWLGVLSAIIMSTVIAGPMISLFTYKIDRRIDDLSQRISEADKRLDFDESHRLSDELKTAEIQYETQKNTVINVLMIACVIVFATLSAFV